MRLAAGIAAGIVFALVAGAVFVFSGLYDISATDQHLRPTYHLIRITMERSIERRAQGIAVPPLGEARQVERGLLLYRTHCAQCHGAPGVAPEPFALGLRPLPQPLMRSGKDRGAAFLFWVTKYGIKMTAMPAWEFRLDDDDIWATVAFLKAMAAMKPAEYARRQASQMPKPPANVTAAPDPSRGKRALEQYACVGCHETPGVIGPEAHVGPTLHGVGARQILAGFLPNTPDNLVRWIREPQKLKPGTAMPDLGVAERDARDMAAYLATLR